VKVHKAQRKGFNSAVIFGSWTCGISGTYMFEGVAPPLPAAQLFFKEELQHWCFAGARKLQMLFPGQGEGIGWAFFFWLDHATVLVQVF